MTANNKALLTGSSGLVGSHCLGTTMKKVKISIYIPKVRWRNA